MESNGGNHTVFPSLSLDILFPKPINIFATLPIYIYEEVSLCGKGVRCVGKVGAFASSFVICGSNNQQAKQQAIKTARAHSSSPSIGKGVHSSAAKVHIQGLLSRRGRIEQMAQSYLRSAEQRDVTAQQILSKLREYDAMVDQIDAQITSTVKADQRKAIQEDREYAAKQQAQYREAAVQEAQAAAQDSKQEKAQVYSDKEENELEVLIRRYRQLAEKNKQTEQANKLDCIA